MTEKRRPTDSLLGQEIRLERGFGSLEEEAFLNLQRSDSLLTQSFAQLLKRAAGALTPAQYNVLRILRGAHPDALSCGEIGDRMVTADPDVTRLVDRLVGRNLVDRTRDTRDRRVVKVVINPRGLDLLGTLDTPVAEWLQQRLGHLEDAQLGRLIQLLEALRSAPNEAKMD